MFEMLAVLTPPVIGLMLVALAIALMIIVPKMRKSSKIDKLADDLFGEAPRNKTDELLNNISDAKEGLVNKVKENTQKVKDAIKDTEKINKKI